MMTSNGTVPALDAILTAHATGGPDRLALIDRSDRWTYRRADRAVGTIAARLRSIGLAPGTVVGLQMPNTAASVVVLLAVMRAGMIPAPLPLLWRRKDCVAALSEAGARAIVTCGRVGDFDHAALALEVAAELFPIRAVCGIGCAAMEGIIPLDELLNDADNRTETLRVQDAGPASPALVTFETTADGIVPIARDATQLIAGGRLVRQRAEIGSGAVILTSISSASYAGVSAALVPWLLGGGTLVLHDSFHPETLREQIDKEQCDVLVVPNGLLPGLAASDWLDPPGIRSVVAIWRSPERFASAAQWTNLDVALIDVAAFGESGLLAARRSPGGRTSPWPIGKVRIADTGSTCAEVAVTPGGTLGLSGLLAASPYRPYGTGDKTDDSSPADRHVDTGYPCRITPDQQGLVVTAPPAGLVAVGGYRFPIHDLQRLIRDIDRHGVLAALPHAVTGHRLAGHASDLVTMRGALQNMSVNPLVTAAFGRRSA